MHEWCILGVGKGVGKCPCFPIAGSSVVYVHIIWVHACAVIPTCVSCMPVY